MWGEKMKLNKLKWSQGNTLFYGHNMKPHTWDTHNTNTLTLQKETDQRKREDSGGKPMQQHHNTNHAEWAILTIEDFEG